jgi:hypothetical protein
VDSLRANAGLAAAGEHEGVSVPEGLLPLVRWLQAGLVPLEPRPAFVTNLQGRLAAQHATAAATRASARAKEKEVRLRWVAGLGGALYLASLGFVSFRAAQAVTGRVAALAAARGDQAALPRASIAT